MLEQLTIASAALGLGLTHYIFSFQRFTLAAARRLTAESREVRELQVLMTPALMGALGWLGTIVGWGAVALLWIAFTWVHAAIYVVVRFILVGAVLPLLPLRNHFARLVDTELQSHMTGGNAAVAVRLALEIAALHEVA